MSHYDEETLALIALGELAVTADGGAHLTTCGQCHEDVRSLREVVTTARTIRDSDHPIAPRGQVWDRIVAEIVAHRRGAH